MYCCSCYVNGKYGASTVNKGLLFCGTKENVNTDWNKHDHPTENIQYIPEACDLVVQ